jgi:hypothetical protein
MKSETWKQEDKWTNLEKEELCKSNVMSSSLALPWGLCLIYYASGNLWQKEAKSIKTLLGFWFLKNSCDIQWVSRGYLPSITGKNTVQAIWKIDCLQTFHFPKCLMNLCNTLSKYTKNKIWGLYRPLAPFFFKVFKILLWIRDPGVGWSGTYRFMSN